MNAVVIQNVSKSYNKGEVTALSDITFNVSKGELFGIIGPDGAGKSTLFRILTTLLLPDQGSVMVWDLDTVKDYRKIREIVGYMPGKFSLYQDLTVEENLNFFATVFNTTIKENYHLIKDIYFMLEPFKNRRAGQLSGGMKQKLALCCALIHKPTVLFLDEPTTGVDPVSRKEFREMLKRLKNEGITIIVSTPYMDEAAECDRIAFLHHGRILSINTPENILQSFPLKLFKTNYTDTLALLKAVRSYGTDVNAYPFGDSIHITLNEEDKTVAGLSAHLLAQLGEAIEIKAAEPVIEDCFINLLRS